MTFERLSVELRDRLSDEPVPHWRPPMLATLTEQRFSDPGWIFERKLDGIRCLAYRDGDRVRLLSRNQQSLETRQLNEPPFPPRHVQVRLT